MWDEHIVCLSKWNQPQSVKEVKTQISDLSEPAISFVVLCKNEARCIERCLRSIQSECEKEDEVIVIDTGSTDNSQDIVRRIKGCRLIETEWRDDFSVARNAGIDCASNNWLFFIDADEVIVSESVGNLKKALRILDANSIKDVILSPAIMNSNMHVSREVKRIFRKADGIFYHGCIHEEPRKSIEKLGADLIHLALDNVILEHDGYKKDVVKLKDKGNRNAGLLRKMISAEPQYPRWKYFLCRDIRGDLDKTEYEQLLKEVIRQSAGKPPFMRYRIRATSDLISYYIDNDRLLEAEELLSELEKLDKDLSDIVYFRHFIRYVKCKKEYLQILQSLGGYLDERTEIEYGGIHSSYYHIEYLMALLLFDLREYEYAFRIFKRLDAGEFIDLKNMYQNLYSQLADC